MLSNDFRVGECFLERLIKIVGVVEAASISEGHSGERDSLRIID